jgi:hypothetical protein
MHIDKEKISSFLYFSYTLIFMIIFMHILGMAMGIGGA